MKKMKTLKIGAFAILGLLAVACNDDDNKNTAKLSSEEQAEMVASSMGSSGFAGSAEQASMYADGDEAGRQNAECGVETESGLDLAGTLGGITYVYNSDFLLELNCNENEEAESFRVDFGYTGSYNGPRFESSYSGDAELMITGLSDEDDSFEIDGSYSREGDFKTKVNGEVSEEGEHNIDINVTENIVVAKSNHKVTSGKADISASGSIEGRGSYSFDAEVTFSGTGSSRKATIRVSDDTYELNIESNTVVKVD